MTSKRQHLPIWYMSSIDPSICDKAVEGFNAIGSTDAAMGASGDNINHSQRKTSVRFAHNSHWFGELMYKFAKESNEKAEWNYEIDRHEAVQFAHYGPEHHYDWHTDTFTLSGCATDRKVTVVCLMNDPSEFEGGEFQIRLYNDYVAPLSKGSLIAFPSILYHRVTPVISGLRMTATIWTSGPRFK